jgi:hypothetical protein
MEEKVSHLPVLRFGEVYKSLDTNDLGKVLKSGARLEVSVANAGIIRRDKLSIEKGRAALRAIPADTLLSYAEKAADIYLDGEVPFGIDGETQGVADYVTALSELTGLPHSLCRSNMFKVAAALQNIRAVLAGLTRGLPPELFDNGCARLGDIDMNFFPIADSLGVTLPSNSPGVNSLWLPALVMKTPVFLKPGREDPLTPFRIIQAMIQAGFPKEAFGFYPTTHEGGDAILLSCGRGIVFGSDATVKKYSKYSNIQVHGSGRSKVLIGEDIENDWEKHLDVMVESVSANGGRSCINASSVMVPSHFEEISNAMAKKLAEVEPRSRDDKDALLCGFANADFAKAMDEAIDDALKTPGAVDLTAKYRNGPRLVEKHGQTFLCPTLIACSDPDHPLANTEYMFPFVSVVERPQSEMLDAIGSTLVVSAVTEDEEWMRELMASPDIDRLNLGSVPTNWVQWEQPHEGNLFEFLYRRRAIQSKALKIA